MRQLGEAAVGLLEADYNMITRNVRTLGGRLPSTIT